MIARGLGSDAAATFLGHTSTAITEGYYIERDRTIDPTPAAHLDRTLRPVDPEGALLARPRSDEEEHILDAVDPAAGEDSDVA